MKRVLIKTYTCVAFIILFSVSVKAQEVVKGLKQVFDITLDDLGNANVEVSMKLNAAQWDMFKKNVGNNTSILKREMEKALPKYYLSDFSYSEDQMERTYKMKFKVLGLCAINSNGKWESKLDMKNPDVTKLSDREFVMNTDMVANGMFINQTQKIHLPSNASDAKIEKDSFGNAVMTFETGNTGTSKATMYGGIALVLIGCGLFYKNSRPTKPKLKVAKEESVAA